MINDGTGMETILKNTTGLRKMGLLIAAIVIVAALGAFFARKSILKETITIGAILPMSGPASIVGEEVRDGMLLAIDEINSWGGINGRRIELIITDSKTAPQSGQEAFNTLETTRHPLLYVSALSSVSMALAPLAEEHDVVLMGLLVSAPAFTGQNEWLFKYFSSPEAEASSILSIVRELQVKSLGILYLNDAYGKPMFELLKTGVEKHGGTVRHAAFDTQHTDFATQIASLKETEAICAVGFPEHFKHVLTQLKAAGFQGAILGGLTADNPVVTSMPEADGVYLSAPIIHSPNYLFAKEAREKYQTRYQKPFSHEAGIGYDFAKILAGLLEDQELSRESVKRLFEEGFVYSGVFGDLELKPGEREIGHPLYPARIKDGEITYLR